MSIGPAMLTMAVDGWTVRACHGLPPAYDHYRRHAALAEEIDPSGTWQDGVFFLAATAGSEPWPRLAVAQNSGPLDGGTGPGIALVPGSGVLFSGIGSRLLAYSLRGRPRRLWEDTAEMGFWHWSVHGDIVLMAAELELAAWDCDGAKLWTTFTEPPWTYQVSGGQIELDVMGRKSAFPARTGPQPPRAGIR